MLKNSFLNLSYKHIDMKIDKLKQNPEQPKTYLELKHEVNHNDKNEQSADQPSSQPAVKPNYGSPEYELRGIGWNVKQMNEKLGRLGCDLENSIETTHRLLDDVIAQQKDTNRLLGDILQFLKNRFTLNQ